MGLERGEAEMADGGGGDGEDSERYVPMINPCDFVRYENGDVRFLLFLISRCECGGQPNQNSSPATSCWLAESAPGTY
jgi:hypothetical protein